ncbi:MAG: DUF4251 domain-containing protein, partial [Muribaculaceae bacterium]|nr:DUF4251 domain-containing protein [Muribaculaceae bacterium]
VYKMLDSISAVRAAEAMQNLDFVVNGSRVTIGNGATFNCDDQTTNFVSVHNGKAMLQLASMRGRTGYNGLGGVTLEGRITKSDLKTDKNGNMILVFNVSGPALSAFVNISLPKNGTQAIVQINPSFRRDLTMYGALSKYDDTKIFVGSKPF